MNNSADLYHANFTIIIVLYENPKV